MSILEGVKASTCRTEKPRFVIKPRPTVKQNRDQALPEQIANDGDVLQLIEYIINKSVRLRQLLEKRAIYNQQTFFQRHLHRSLSFKTLLKQILDKMMNDRRLGRGLKGMNKSNLTEIQNAVWSTIEREATLYHNDLDYTRQKELLSADLKRRKEDVLGKLRRLGGEEQSEQKIMLTENPLNQS